MKFRSPINQAKRATSVRSATDPVPESNQNSYETIQVSTKPSIELTIQQRNTQREAKPDYGAIAGTDPANKLLTEAR